MTDAVIETLQFNSSNNDPRELGQISDFQLERELNPTGNLPLLQIFAVTIFCFLFTIIIIMYKSFSL